MKNIRFAFIALFVLAAMSLCAQSNIDGEHIELKKMGSHYVFSANINGVSEATVLLESGIPAMLADSAFVFSKEVLSGLKLLPANGEKINLGGRVLKISHKASGVVKINDQVFYKGEVFILPDYTKGFAKGYEVAVPVQHLHNNRDNGSRIVRLSLENNSLMMLSKGSLRKQKDAYSKCKMNTKSYMGMPALETEISMSYDGKSRVLKGNFNIDLGNPELVFLMDQHKDVQQFLIENSDIELKQARNPRGDVIAQFIFADQCELCDMQFPNAVILITKNLPRFTTVGNIGLKFFKSNEAIFDFDRNVMYVK